MESYDRMIDGLSNDLYGKVFPATLLFRFLIVILNIMKFAYMTIEFLKTWMYSMMEIIGLIVFVVLLYFISTNNMTAMHELLKDGGVIEILLFTILFKLTEISRKLK